MAISDDKKMLYVDADAEYPAITPWQVAQCLGDYRTTKIGRDIGLLCTSPKINMWPKHKPVRFPSKGVLTDEMLRSANYGLDMAECFDSTAEGLIAKAISSMCSYTYLKPRGLDYDEPLRLRDFDGYRHDAQAPYSYTFYNSVQNASGWIDVYMSAKADLKLSDIAPTFAEADLLSHKIVLLYRKTDATTGVNVTFAKKEDGSYVTLADIENEDGAGCILRFTLTEGKYHVVVAATSATEEDMEDRSWFYLPNAYFTAEYDPSEAGFSWYYPEDNSIAARDSSGKVVYDTTTDIFSVHVETAITSEDANLEGEYVLEIGELGEYFEEVESYTEQYSLQAGGTVNFIKTFTGINNLLGNPYTDKIYVRASLTYRVAQSSSAYKTAYFNFLKGELSSVEQNPVSIKRINDNMEW